MLSGGSSPRTIIGWLKDTSNQSSSGPFGYGKGDCNNVFYMLIRGTGTTRSLKLDYWCEGFDEGINPVTTLERNRWYHVAISWNGSANRAYIDGQFRKQGVPDTSPNTKVDDS